MHLCNQLLDLVLHAAADTGQLRRHFPARAVAAGTGSSPGQPRGAALPRRHMPLSMTVRAVEIVLERGPRSRGMSLPSRSWAQTEPAGFPICNRQLDRGPAGRRRGTARPASAALTMLRSCRAISRAAATRCRSRQLPAHPECRSFAGTRRLSREFDPFAGNGAGRLARDRCSVARTGVRQARSVEFAWRQTRIEILSRESGARHGMLAVAAAFARFGYPDGLFSPEEIARPRLGASRPRCWPSGPISSPRKSSRISPRPALAWSGNTHGSARLVARPAFGWLYEDLNPQGALGNAARANAAKGAEAAEFGAGVLIELLQDVGRFPVERLREGPLG